MRTRGVVTQCGEPGNGTELMAGIVFRFKKIVTKSCRDRITFLNGDSERNVGAKQFFDIDKIK